MREQPVVAQGDAETGGDVEEKEERYLEPVEAVVPDVERHGCNSQGVNDSEENARCPIDAIPRDAGDKWYLHGEVPVPDGPRKVGTIGAKFLRRKPRYGKRRFKGRTAGPGNGRMFPSVSLWPGHVPGAQGPARTQLPAHRRYLSAERTGTIHFTATSHDAARAMPEPGPRGLSSPQ